MKSGKPGACRRVFAGAFAIFLAGHPAPAADQGAEAFLRSIYRHYHGTPEENGGIPIDGDQTIRAYFEPGLAARIVADDAKAAKAGDVPTLDGDPFIDAQDWDIKELTLHIDREDATKASATVRFTNFGKANLIRIQLVRLPQGWRIADIVPRGDTSLRALYFVRK